jgi:hypothetical protein
MTKTRYGTASAAASAATEEEEECDGCDGADPRRRLDDSLLRLADGILLRSIVTTTAGAAATAVGSTVIATMSMPVIDVGTLVIGWEDREGDDGSGVATEDDDDTDADAGGYARDFLEVILSRLWEGRFGKRRSSTKTTETSRDNEHEEDAMTRSMFETLCEGKPSPSSSKARPKRRSPETTVARAGGVDPSRTKRSRTGRGQRRRRNGGCVGDDNDYERLPYIQRRDAAHNNILKYLIKSTSYA